MADRTGIEWTDATWNPVRGCARVSDGCRHCYAERVAARFCGPGQAYEGLIHDKTGAWNGQVQLVPEALAIPWRWARGRRIFVNSMSDLFHPAVPFEFIAAVFFIMGHTTRHTYQILTKRPERALEFFKWVEEYEDGFFPGDRISDVAMDHPTIAALGWEPATKRGGGYDNCGPAWPYENVWLGVSVENQAAARERIPLLIQCPAAVRWISAEPLLGPLSLRWFPAWPENAPTTGQNPYNGGTTDHLDGLRRLDWVVVGGESGTGARPMHPDWARALRDECAEAGVPFLFKQWGNWAPTAVQPGGDLGGDIRRDRVRFVKPAGEPDGHFRRGDEVMAKVGKKAAGRLLDGVLHDAYPEAANG